MIAMKSVREIALTLLKQMGRGQHPIRECYLISKETFAGIRYQAGPLSFVWNSEEEFASVRRGEMLIQTVNLAGGSETKRAA